MTIDEQISKLNREVKCRLGQSRIHGVGVFAMCDIEKGEKLYVDRKIGPVQWYKIPPSRFSDLRPDVRALILDRWPQLRNGNMFLSPNDDQHLISFMNHDEDPNSSFGYAIKDIRAGEEVTEDYGIFDSATMHDVTISHYAPFV
jgi:hypothetical protein